MAIMEYPVKNYASSYIYSKDIYEKPIINTIINCTRIDKHSKEFENVINDVKRRQETVVLSEVMMRDSVVLFISQKGLPDAFSVFSAKDVKDERKETKVFIDCTNIIQFKNGFYTCNRTDVLTAYLISAMNQLIYYTDAKRIVTNVALCTSATECFVSMFYYVLDYLRLSGLAENTKKIQYMIAMYFQTGVLLKPSSESTKSIAAKIAGITMREANLIDVLYDEERDFRNILTFINRLVDIFKFKGFTIDVFVERWRYLFGRGTQFGPELYPAFASIITNAYSGCYLNQQKTIEKCVGRELVTFTTTLLRIGHDAFVRS